MIHSHKTFTVTIVAVLIAAIVFAAYPSAYALMKYVRGQEDAAPTVVSGKEVIYSYIDKGDIRVADQILADSYEVTRFEPIHLETITWKEDPYKDIYWRFNFYNLQPVRHLIYAWEITGNPVYKERAIEHITDFIDNGIDGPYSWDLHGAAFRTMTLINVWEKLDRDGELSPEFALKLQQSLERHGTFLADPEHFEDDYNHGLDQAAALYLLSVNFPDMPKAGEWRDLAQQRITRIIRNIVTSDGILVENAPFYHFYVLEKLWEIDAYIHTYDLPEFEGLDETVEKMVAYATHILQPNNEVPTLGASLLRHVGLAGLYRELGKYFPEFLYVLTQGADGSRPDELNMHYPENGQTIMRSGWGKGEEFINQTQLIFDVGNFRTNHSDLDALSFHLYSRGKALMPDAGLYSYEAGPYRSYFHGTRAHNTVVVDGKDQASAEKLLGSIEKVHAGFFEEGDGYVYQSAEHELYQGVSHKRAIAMVEDSTIVILDTLTSASEHVYEQMFHLFPGATIATSTDGLTLKVTGDDPRHTMTIRQLAPEGITLTAAIDKHNPPEGLCSVEYKIATPCYALSYKQKGKDVSYVTVITIGEEEAEVAYDAATRRIDVTTERATYGIGITEIEGQPRRIEVNKNYALASMYARLARVEGLNDFTRWSKENEDLKASLIADAADQSIQVSLPMGESYIEISNDTAIDLTNKILYFKVKVDRADNLADMELVLSNNQGEKTASYNLRGGAYDIDDIHRDNDWFQYGLGVGKERPAEFGNWVVEGGEFDWSKIDRVQLLVESELERPVTVDIKDFRTGPAQTQSRVVIVFDDGWQSVWDAAQIMHKYGFKGNVPIITSTIGRDSYLTMDELHTLQNDYDWNIVNHTQSHKNATTEYVYTNSLDKYESDIVDALQFLIQNNLNSAPNWFIYPHGKTDSSTKAIIGKYYKFARATMDGPESFPYAEPLEVRTFSVYSDNTSLQEVYDAIDDAKTYNQTLTLMFHKFSEGRPTLFTEWSYSDFEKILQYIQRKGIKVVTFSELDQEMGIPPTEFTLREVQPPHFELAVAVEYKSALRGFLSKLFQ